MFKRRKILFDIKDVPPIDPSKKPIEIDIGFLANEAHTNAFIDIFDKMISDNWLIFAEYDRVDIKAEKPLGPLAKNLNEPGGVVILNEKRRQIAEELYFTYNDNVTLWFIGAKGKKEVFVAFDSPYFAFDGMQRIDKR
jgi:hypothetical protein